MGKKAQQEKSQTKRKEISTEVLSETYEDNLITCEDIQEEGNQKNEDELIQQESASEEENVQMPASSEREAEEKEREECQVELKIKINEPKES